MDMLFHIVEGFLSVPAGVHQKALCFQLEGKRMIQCFVVFDKQDSHDILKSFLSIVFHISLSERTDGRIVE